MAPLPQLQIFGDLCLPTTLWADTQTQYVSAERSVLQLAGQYLWGCSLAALNWPLPAPYLSQHLQSCRNKVNSPVVCTQFTFAALCMYKWDCYTYARHVIVDQPWLEHKHACEVHALSGSVTQHCSAGAPDRGDAWMACLHCVTFQTPSAWPPC